MSIAPLVDPCRACRYRHRKHAALPGPRRRRHLSGAGRRDRCRDRAPLAERRQRTSTTQSANGPATPNRSRLWSAAGPGTRAAADSGRAAPQHRRVGVGAGDAAVAYARGSLLALIGVLSEVPWLVLVPVLAFLLLKDAASITAHVLPRCRIGCSCAASAVRGAERDAGGLCPGAADRVCRGRRSCRASARAARATRTPCCSACLPRCWSSFR